MKHNRLIIFIAIVLAVSVFSTGCAKKISEKIGEKVLEKALGDDVKINTKDNTVSIDTKDGSLQMGSDLDWPTDKLKPLPKPKGEVTSITDLGIENTISVSVNFSDPKGPRDYLKKIQDLGYIQSTISESEGFFSYIGYKDDNTQVSFYSMDSGEGAMITLTTESEEAKEYFNSEQEGDIELNLTDVDMTDEVNWPKDQMDKVPELEGKIINVTSSKEYVFIELEYVKEEDALSFIEAVKKQGFNVNSSQTTSKNSILYMTQNDKGYNLSINWYGNGAGISYSKP